MPSIIRNRPNAPTPPPILNRKTPPTRRINGKQYTKNPAANIKDIQPTKITATTPAIPMIA